MNLAFCPPSIPLRVHATALAAAQDAADSIASPNGMEVAKKLATELDVQHGKNGLVQAVMTALEDLFTGPEAVYQQHKAANRAGRHLQNIRQTIRDFTGLPETESDRALVKALADKWALDGLFVPDSLSCASIPAMVLTLHAPATLPAELPSSLRVLPWGRNESTKGPVILDDYSHSVLPGNQRLMGRERVQLDFEHNTVPGTEEYNRTKEPRPVAAYGTPVIMPGIGLHLMDLKWTPEGKMNARNYEDLSPAPIMIEDGRVIALHSVALTRAGAVCGLTAFSTSTLLATRRSGVHTFNAALEAYKRSAGCNNEQAFLAIQRGLPNHYAALCSVRPVPLSSSPNQLMNTNNESPDGSPSSFIPASDYPASQKIRERMAKMKTLIAQIRARDNVTYEEAYRRASREQPDLFRE